MKATRRIIAVLLTVLLMIPNTSALALENPMAGEKLQTEETSGIAESTEEASKTEGTSSTAQSTEENSKTEENSSIAEKTEDPSKTEGASSTAESTEEFSKTEKTSSTAEKTEESSKTEETSSTTESTEETSKTEENPSTAQSTEESSKTEETSGTAESTNVEETFETGDTLEEETETATATEMETEIEIETLEEKILNKENLSALMEDAVQFNTGNYLWSVISAEAAGEGELSITDSCVFFAEDGSYTIDIPEENPFFPYEVQFTYHGEVTTEWFMTPQSSVEVGGHTFYVSPRFDGTAVTQMSLNVGGDTVVVYPERKEFTNDGNQLNSLLPLKEVPLTVNLSAYTPAELTMVSIDSIFTGENALTNKDNVVWTYGHDNDDYIISQSGDVIDLSYRTTSYVSYSQWQMIAKVADQLEANNVRYLVNIEYTNSRYWLTSTVYTQDETGVRTGQKIISKDNDYYDDLWGSYNSEFNRRRKNIGVASSGLNGASDVYVSLKINNEIFANTQFKSIKAFEGKYTNATEAAAGGDITDKLLCTDMSVKDAGYLMKVGSYSWVTLVTYDASEKVTGCLPLELYLYTKRTYIECSPLCLETENGIESTSYGMTSNSKDGCDYYTHILYKEYSASEKYTQTLSYYRDEIESNSLVTAAYIGNYASIAEAVSNNAEDIKDALFGNGFTADYSNGVYITIFVGADDAENQEVYKLNLKAQTGTKSKNDKNNEIKDEPNLSSETLVCFERLFDENGNLVKSYSVKNREDSYAEYNYLTIIVEPDTDLTKLAPEFHIADDKIKLYTAGSSSPEISRKSIHDFSNGPVQYTASAEDKENSRNYWLQVVKASSGTGQLYANSLKDTVSETNTTDGVVYSKRKMMLDSYHHYEHDILLINMGTDPINALKAELVSDTLELDEYWSLSGNYALSGFTTTQEAEGIYYGELSNMAKIRLRKKENVENGTKISGTLTIKSGEKTLMVFALSGTVGDPQITTKEIPQAVKYVPYGTMIQNNNKYSWNKVSYKLESGSLPGGMEIKKNGELYGVPTEAGEFKFTVCMKNSSKFSDSRATLTLEVIENTDTNVNNATDQGYDVLQRIQDVTIGTTAGDRLFISQGLFTDFEHHVYLDGRELEENVEYSAASGSTRITIKSETLDDLDKGKHTLGVEFRDDEESLKRAAQNFNVKKKGSNNSNNNNSQNDNNNSSNDNSNSSHTNDDDDGDSNSNSVSPAVSNTANKNANIPSAADSNLNLNININADASANAAAPEAVTTVSYTVETGDTLWKIAEKFYGSGTYWNKVYEDNAATISSPDRIFAGQTIMIYITQMTAFTQPSEVNPVETDNTAVPVPEVEAVVSEDGITKYIVQPRDTLWKIAKEFYGRGWEWRRIYEANGNVIPDPASLLTGRVLVIPTR